jgi:hypothetical protein
MARTLYVAPVPPLNATAGAAYVSSSTLADVSPTPQLVLPANLLDVGQVIRLRAFGTFSNTATPTLLLGFYYGGVAGTALAATSAITTTTGATNWQFSMEYEGRIRSTGTAGTILGAGWIDLATSLTAVTHRPIPETALATVTIDTTTAKNLTLGAQWGTLSASNTLTCHHFSVELIG